jgi:hypothetical protein
MDGGDYQLSDFRALQAEGYEERIAYCIEVREAALVMLHWGSVCWHGEVLWKRRAA